jgi:hypothetical protein
LDKGSKEIAGQKITARHQLDSTFQSTTPVRRFLKSSYPAPIPDLKDFIRAIGHRRGLGRLGMLFLNVLAPTIDIIPQVLAGVFFK